MQNTFNFQSFSGTTQGTQRRAFENHQGKQELRRKPVNSFVLAKDRPEKTHDSGVLGRVRGSGGS